MGRLLADYNASKNNRISIKKQNLGGGKMLRAIDLLKYLSDQIDPIIQNLTANNDTLKLFSTEEPNGICCQGVGNSTTPVNPIYIRNTNCWAKNIDTTPISIWNNGGGLLPPENAGGSGGTGILITRRHILLANHFRMVSGSKLIFVDMNNNTYVRELVSSIDPLNAVALFRDIQIGLLDSDLPNSISNIKILDPVIGEKLRNELFNNNKRIPVFLMDQSRKAFVGELIGQGHPSIAFAISENPTNPSKRREFYPNPPNYYLVGGDSANTCSIVYNNKLVHVFHFRNRSSGPSAHTEIDEINKAINLLGNPNNYTVEIESFNI